MSSVMVRSRGGRDGQQGLHAIQRGEIGQRLRSASDVERDTGILGRALPGQQHRQRRRIDLRQARAIDVQRGKASFARLAELSLALAQNARRFAVSQRAGQGQHGGNGCVRKRNSGQN